MPLALSAGSTSNYVGDGKPQQVHMHMLCAFDANCGMCVKLANVLRGCVLLVFVAANV